MFSKNLEDTELLKIYQLGVSSIICKPFEVSLVLEEILSLVHALNQDRNFNAATIEKLQSDLLYERKRIGRFMLNEKKLNEKIKIFEDTTHVNKNIYELTKLPSRYALQSALGDSKHSLLYLNIDHFDFINTVYGMGKANKLLKECSLRLKKFLPNNGELFHITADEFVILLDEPLENQDLLLATQMQALFREAAIEFEEFSHFIVFSIGIDRGVGKTLFVNAKSASKEARYFGGNQVTIFNAHSEYMREQRESLYWIRVLQKAFEEDKVFTYYQPIIHHANPNLKHYEVLCRLKDDHDNLIDATKFIAGAKIAGLITQITRTVIDKTFKMFANNDYNFSLNITLYDLHEEYLLKLLTYKCQRYNISPKRVYLEIVEDIILSKTTVIDTQILELKESGFHVIIDDFGTDKSSYSRMFDLKAEFIKINGSFIKELGKDNSYKIIVQSIVDFAKKSGIKTIAEHVENLEVYEMVKELGIDYSQGYLLGRPSISLE